MEKKCIILDPGTFAIRLGAAESQKPGEIILISHDNILDHLPESVRTNPVAEAVQKIVALAFGQLAHIEIPIIGTGKLKLVLDRDLAQPTEEAVKHFLSSLVEDQNLPTRSLNCLGSAGFKFCYELLVWDRNEFFKLRNFGKQSVDQLEALLASKGVSGEIKSRIQDKTHSLEELRLSEIPEVMANESFKKLLEEVRDIADLSQEKAGRLSSWGTSLKYVRFHKAMFPWRDSKKSPRIDELTPYEKKFRKDEEKKNIEGLLDSSREILDKFYHTEMEKFIHEM